MKKINWHEMVALYNSIFGTKYVQLIAVLRAGCRKFDSLKEFASKLGISPETLRSKLADEKIKGDNMDVKRSRVIYHESCVQLPTASRIKRKAQKIQPLEKSAFFDEIPSCRICGAPLIATCDRNKPSELVEYMGMGWTKTKPQLMWVYPTAEKQSDLCFYHQQKEM
jgi:DNA-binding Lrp family transcriptional regulator